MKELITAFSGQSLQPENIMAVAVIILEIDYTGYLAASAEAARAFLLLYKPCSRQIRRLKTGFVEALDAPTTFGLWARL
jgi:hypothetical protein